MNSTSTVTHDLKFKNFFSVRQILLQSSPSNLDSDLYNHMMDRDFNIIKMTIEILYPMADLKAKHLTQSNLPLFNVACNKLITTCIIPLISSLKVPNQRENMSPHQISIKLQVLSKFWGVYINILSEAYRENSEKKGWSDDVRKWFPRDFWSLWDETWILMENEPLWRVYLSKECFCVGRFLFRPYFKELIKNYHQIQVLSFMNTRIKAEIEALHDDEIGQFVKRILVSLGDVLLKAMRKPNGFIAAKVILGRFQKNKNLQHSVIFGDNGGFYVLLNSLTEEEKNLLENTGTINKDYSSNWKKTIENKYKIIIGQGTFGKIRLALSLTRNPLVPTMKAGQIVCIKKTTSLSEAKINMKKIRRFCWNDYSSSEVIKYIYAPTIYDLKIMSNREMIAANHCKGYTIQQFQPFLDGKKAFDKGTAYHCDWSHQRPYLIDVFQGIHDLLSRGICMTDLKLANTLYDPINRRGMLIDLAGVVIKRSKKALENCKIKYVSELTEAYSAPELIEALQTKSKHTKMNLCKCMSYSLGVICKRTGESSKEVEELIQKMTVRDVNKRILVEEGLEILISGSQKMMISKINELKGYIQDYIEKIRAAVKKNTSRFGLTLNFQLLKDFNIDLKLTELDPDRIPNLNIFDIESEFEKCLAEEKPVFVLLGSSGTGKSTFLQRKYLQAIENWKLGDPFPFFMNLASKDNLKSHWEWIRSELNENNCHFSSFSGKLQYPMKIFLDSFDEVNAKTNFVSQFFDELGRNPKNRLIVACRSEFIQKDDVDFDKWFSVNELSTFKFQGNRRYIAPLDYVGNTFDLKKYLEDHLNRNNPMDLMVSNENSDLLQKFSNIQSLQNLLKTIYMVRLTIEILPEITNISSFYFSRYQIYEKYSHKQIMKEAARFNQMKPEDFLVFVEQSAIILAKMLYKSNSSRINFLGGGQEPFLQRHNYDCNLPCLENSTLAAFIRALDLILETRGSVPNEIINLGFSHDTMKNYYLIKAIKQELLAANDQNDESILGERSIVDDDVLIRSIAEEVQCSTTPKLEQTLKKIIFNTKEIKSNINNITSLEQRKITAAANAITILVASDVNLIAEDFRNVRICGANLRDGNFNMCDFSDADLTGVILENCKLDSTLFNGTNLANIKLGPQTGEIQVGMEVMSCCLCENGLEVLTGDTGGHVKVWKVSTGKLLKEYEGHEDSVTSVAISNGETMMVSGSRDKTVILWDKSTGERLKRFRGHLKSVMAVAFSPNGQKIISGSGDKTVKLWNTTGQKLQDMKGHDDTITSVCFSPDGESLISGSDDATVNLWETNSGKLLKTFEVHHDCVTSVMFSPDGQFIISGSWDKTIKLWDKNTGKVVKSFEGHQACVTSVAFSRDGQSIVSGSLDEKVMLWDRETGKTLKTFDVHKKSVTFVAFSADGHSIVSGSYDKTVKIWAKYSGKLLKSFEGDKGNVTSIAMSYDGKYVLSGSDEGIIKLWDKSTAKVIKILRGHQMSITSVAFSNNGKYILSSSLDKTLILWDSYTGKSLKNLMGHQGAVKCGVFSPNNELIASGSQDKMVIIWDISTGKPLQIMEGHKNYINSVAFSPDNQIPHIVSASQDATIKVWDKQTGKMLKTINLGEGPLTSVEFSQDGLSILVLPQDKKAPTIYDLYEKNESSEKMFKFREESNEKVFLKSQEESLTSATFYPNRSSKPQIFMTASNDKTIKFWDRATAIEEKEEKNKEKSLKTLKSHNTSVTSLVFSSDGQSFLAVANNKMIRLWVTTNELCLKGLAENENPVVSVEFSPNGLEIVTICKETFKLWNKQTGLEIRSFIGHQNNVTSVAFSPDGKSIVSGSSDKTVKLWDKSTGKIKSFVVLQNVIIFVTFSTNGKEIISKTSNHDIQAWDISTEKLITIDSTYKAQKYFLSLRFDFNCVLNFKNSESSLSSKDMIILDAKNLSVLHRNILIQSGAIDLKGATDQNDKKNQKEEDKDSMVPLF